MKLSKYVADVRHIVRTNAVLLRRAAMICLVLTLVVQASVFAFSRAYQIGYSPQTDLSLPWRFLLVEKRAPEQHVIQRGEIVQFSLPAAARAFKVTAEVFPPQVSFTKIVAGVPGDHFQVDSSGRLYVNNELWGELDLRVVDRLYAKTSDFVREGVVPADSYFMAGSGARSFDSRYFGVVPKGSIGGRAWPLF